MTEPTVTSPFPGRAEMRIINSVRRMQTNAMPRDASMHRVLCIRRGDYASVWPEDFSDKYKSSIIANFIDVACRDFAAQLAPLPSLVSSAGHVRSNADKRRAEKKNRIGAHYWSTSDLEFHMKYGADQYLSYGFLPFWVEADYERYEPIIHVEDPMGAYYELDRFGVCKHYARVWRQDINELAAAFPEYASQILRDQNGMPQAGTDTEVVRWVDNKICMMYLPERSNMIVAEYAHGLVDSRGRPKTPVHIAVRPGVEMDPRGKFDDVIEVQRAAAVMAALTLEAGHKSVQAPLSVPSDVQEIPIGPDAVIVTDQPDKVARIPLNVPPAAFALGQQLQGEMLSGAGYPPSRLGQGPAGGSTGRGISALEGGFDSSNKQDQDVIGLALRRSTEMCYLMELALWPKRRKTVNGTVSGESFSVAYTPGVDLAGDTKCEISYGFAAGLSPNAAIVTLLQLQGAGLIGRDTIRRNLPFDIDLDQQQREIDVQGVEDGMKQGLAAALTATGQMIAQGMTAQAMQFFQAGAQIIAGRREGKELSDLFVEAFAAPPQPAQPQLPGAPGAPGEPGQPGATGPNGEPLPGVGPDGLPEGTAAGQAGMPPGGRPSVTDLVASFGAGGAPRLGASVRRRVPTG